MIWLRVSFLALTVLFYSGCIGNKHASSVDAPDQRWKAALTTFAQGEIKKTDAHLEWLTQTDNQYLQQARSWRLVLLSGMTQGYAELLDRNRKAAAGKPPDPMQHQRDFEALKKVSSRLGFTLEQSYADFQKAHPEGEVLLPFPIPSYATTTLPAALEQVAAGAASTGPQAESMEAAVLQWGITQAICQTAGTTGNLVQARQLYKTLPVRLPRAVFELGIATGMYRASSLFSPSHLGDQQRYASLLYQAKIAVSKAPSGPDTDALAATIQEALNEKH